MRRFSVCVLGVLATALLGCGPNKELPDEVPAPKQGTSPSSGDPFGSPATVSDPAAKAVVDRAIKAITENDPRKLEKAKTVRVIYQGAIQRLDRKDMSNVTRRAELVWPERVRVDDDYKEAGIPAMSFRLRGPHGWGTNGGKLVEGNPADLGRIFKNDIFAEHGVALGLTLVDPQAIVYEPVTNDAGTSVKIAIPDRPIFRVTFSAASGLPVRVEYHPIEGPQRVEKVIELGDHKSTSGMMLPASIRLTQNGTLALRWAIHGWEFPEKIEDSQFDRPQ